MEVNFDESSSEGTSINPGYRMDHGAVMWDGFMILHGGRTRYLHGGCICIFVLLAPPRSSNASRIRKPW